jgi:hypothetical protein
MATEAKLLIVQFLRWIADRPRTYEDVQSAWQSTCPLNCAWEDAVSDDLVAPGPNGFLALTDMGRARLNGAGHPTPP